MTATVSNLLNKRVAYVEFDDFNDFVNQIYPSVSHARLFAAIGDDFHPKCALIAMANVNFSKKLGHGGGDISLFANGETWRFYEMAWFFENDASMLLFVMDYGDKMS